MVSETMFLALFVAWYATSGTGGLMKVKILDDLHNRKLLDLGSQRRVCFEPRMLISFVRRRSPKCCRCSRKCRHRR